MVDKRNKSKKITKSFKTKLNVSKANEQSFKNMAGVYRILYNISMKVMEQFTFDSIWSHKHLLNQIETQHLVKVFMNESEENARKYAFTSEVENGILKAAILEANFINNTRYPFSISKLLRKKDGLKFKTSTQIKIFDDHIYIPKCGNVKLFEKNYLPTGATLSDITFKQKGGDWWLSFNATVNAEEEKVERDFNDTLKIDFKNDGTLVVNNKEYPSIINTARYQKEFKRLRGLLSQYKRMCNANSEYHCNIKRTLVVSRNMLKLRQKIETSTSRLYNMKLDYFRKVSYGLTKTKSGSAQFLSNDIIRKQQNNHLSRAHRQAGTSQFFDILHKKLQHSGIIIHRINSEGVVRPELQGIMACGGLDEYRRMARKSGPMKQVLNSAA